MHAFEDLFRIDRKPEIVSVGLQEVIEMKTKGLTQNIMKKMGLVQERDWVSFCIDMMHRIDPRYYLLAID